MMCEPIAYQDEPDCFQQQRELQEYEQFLASQPDYQWWGKENSDSEWLKEQEGL